MGLDHDSLQAINPGVLFCRLDCFGGPRPGPKSNYIGYDDIIQAISGIMTRFGGPETPEEHAHIGTLDVNCGFSAGLSIALALLHKHKTGKISRCRTSLAAITHLAQIPFAFDYRDRPCVQEPSGRHILGNHALSRFYQTKDGWLFLDSNEYELETLSNIEGLEDITQCVSTEEFLATALKLKSSEHWAQSLQNANIAAAKPYSIEDLRAQYTRPVDDTVGLDRGSYAFFCDPDHPSGHAVTQIDHYAIRPNEASIKKVTPTERFGFSTREILKGLNYSDADIDELIRKNVVGLSWGKEYLPS